MLEPPRSRRGWILLIVSVLFSSTIVTAALSAVLTSILFPDGFLVEATAEAVRQPPGATSPDEAPSAGFSLRASVTCSVSFGDLGDVGEL